MLHVYNAFVHLPVASVFRCAKVWYDRGLWGMCLVLWFTVPVRRDYAVTFVYLNSYVSATHLALILGDETTETRTYFDPFFYCPAPRVLGNTRTFPGLLQWQSDFTMTRLMSFNTWVSDMSLIERV